MRVFIDTNIPMYAAGGEHPLREKCREIIFFIASGKLNAYTDTEVLQEILYRFHHIGRKAAGFQLFDSVVKLMDGRILPVTAPDLLLARRLADQYVESSLAPRDLVHLAVMLNSGIRHIATADKSFTDIAEITVITP